MKSQEMCNRKGSFIIENLRAIKGVSHEWRLDKAQVFFLQRLESLRVWRGRE